MNTKELKIKVNDAMYALIKEKGVASSVDVLLSIGVLSKEHYEDWRFGRVPFLERVCMASLSKLSAINREIRVFAQKNGLKPSWTDYRQWGKGHSIRLRFSKSGNGRIEELYATHYVSQRKVAEVKDRRELRKDAEESALTIESVSGQEKENAMPVAKTAAAKKSAPAKKAAPAKVVQKAPAKKAVPTVKKPAAAKPAPAKKTVPAKKAPAKKAPAKAKK